MKSISLNENLTLVIEPVENKIRLVVVKADNELACRIERVSKLKAFLAGNDQMLFKGRLQLVKLDGEVEIIVNKISIGRIALNSFSQLLSNI
ncbi:MAG: hypothetical protein REI64_01810 [Pedobacter sp.]|uniref:hypothetical protein n=1 Tax=Pedobacter sp. TaxID=1411316 RepID=UPI00280865A3|nr:hypothetical protein [Pedobacter sp.]MDQ8003502.1 hypothetical protein [Pedobacter sp.]